MGRLRRSVGVGVATAIIGLCSPTLLADAEDDQKADLEELGLVNLAVTLAGIAPTDGFTAILIETAALVSNLALKEERAALRAPAGFSTNPNSSDQCTYDFDMSLTHHLYSNFFGIETNPIPAAWGTLGAPYVYHWGTDVIVSANNSHINPNFLVRNAKLPAGDNIIEWRADTLRDEVFDVALPTAMLLSSVWSEMKGGNAAGDAAGNADDVVKQQKVSKSQKTFKKAAAFLFDSSAELLGLPVRSNPVDTAIYLVDSVTGFEKVRTSKSREQVVTVLDLRPPVVTVHQPILTFEATDIGGMLSRRVSGQLLSSVSARDPCDRFVSLGNDIPDLLRIGTNTVTWTARDLGPKNLAGDRNQVVKTQSIIVEDTQAPIMVPPPGRVIEVDPNGPNAAGLADTDIVLGSPRVVDLADPSPVVESTAPTFFPVDTRTSVDWSATDQSSNTSVGNQLITVKTLGTNTAPTVQNVSSSTLTSQPVDIVLTGIDNDDLDGRVDPLSFSIPDRPDNGEFIAPLLPFFIEDYRSAVEGPYGEGFATTNNPPNWLKDNVCDAPENAGKPNNERISRNWVYSPKFVHVMDDGIYYMLDWYWNCTPSSANSSPRMSKWDRDGQLLGQFDYSGTTDAFVVDQDGLLYNLSRVSGTLTLSQVRPNFDEPNVDFTGDSWRFDNASMINPDLGLNDNPSEQTYSYARVDSNRGLLFVTDRRRVFVFDVRADLEDGVDVFDNDMGPKYLGALKNGDQFLCNTGSFGSSWSGFAIEVDSQGNLYVTDSCQDRIHRFNPSFIDPDGALVKGDYLGWMGKCDSSTNNACDTTRQRSRGYSCTDLTCTVVSTSGSKTGQFDTPVYVSLDPNDILYVADAGRVQRFAPDGSFAGEARSTGTGINQGEVPGFILGNLGAVKAVSVNSTQFFVVDQQESFIHVFETTPLKDITDTSATVTYVSNFSFHSNTDTFSYRAGDGLADSNLGTVSVQVARNFRPPVAFDQTLDVDEDTPLNVVLSGDDPDGVIGTSDVFPLDVLSFSIVDQPQNGSVSGADADRTYTPDLDFHGTDSFTFISNDGNENSEKATVSITVNPVNDAPKIEALSVPAKAGAGFPITLVGRHSDDGSVTAHQASVDWGSQQDVNGDFIDPDGEGGDPPELIGLKVHEPPAREGVGSVLGQHTYVQPGTEEVVLCVTDEVGQTCDSQFVVVEHLVNLTLKARSAIDDETTSGFLDIDIEITNQQPSGIAGLPANDVLLTEFQAPEIKVSAILSNPAGACGLSNGQLICNDTSMTPGESYSTRVRVVPTQSEPLIYDLGAPFAFDVTSSSEMVQDVYTGIRWLTFIADATDTDLDGMTDVFENTYGLNPASSNDAQSDADNDGITNVDEYRLRTNPRLRDTDGDGVWDAEDFCPLDEGGSIEGSQGVCEEDIRSSSILRIITILKREQNQ